jgi:hypothetical protein
MPSREEIIKGISAYSHEQDVLLRVIRKHGKLSETDFDRIFNGKLNKIRPRQGVSGTSFILGACQAGCWAMWLELTQLMVAIGFIETETINNKVYYKLP